MEEIEYEGIKDFGFIFLQNIKFSSFKELKNCIGSFLMRETPTSL